MKESELNLDSNPVGDYIQRVRQAKDRQGLLDVVNEFSWCASDALEVVKNMTDDLFDNEFLPGRIKESKGIYAGDEYSLKYGAILLPEKMLMASMVADHFKAPWSVAWMRIKELK